PACGTYDTLPLHYPTLFPYTTLFRSLMFKYWHPDFLRNDWTFAGDFPRHLGFNVIFGAPTLLLPMEVVGSRSVGAPKITLKPRRSEEHTSELQSPDHLVCCLLLEKKK